MSKQINEIKDDEIRAIRPSKSNILIHTQDESRTRKINVWLSSLALVIGCIIVAVIIWSFLQKTEQEPVTEVFEPENIAQETNEPLELLGNYNEPIEYAYTEIIEKTINDIPLNIYIQHNTKASLCIGAPNCNDPNIVFATQAADIRADNHKINGAFVVAGKPVAWGLSKKGYVGIIRDTIHIGKADNSPLFEQATETGGYFFRQYALVENGAVIENEPKNKSYRKAICDREGEIMVVISQTKESFHDFAQALVDLHVTNAVYLVGSSSYGFCRDRDKNLIIFHDKKGFMRNENYIVWSAK